MFLIDKILVMINKAWSSLPLVDEFDVAIEYSIDDLKNNYYECLITYKESGITLKQQTTIQNLLKVRTAALEGVEYTQPEKDAIEAAVNVSELVGLLNEIGGHSPIRYINRPKALRYSDLWDYGYHAERGYYGAGDGHHNDIYITNKTAAKTPAENINNLLYTLAGKVMFPDVVGDDIYIRNSYYRLNTPGRQFISVLDFTELGGFISEIITADKVTVLSSNKTRSIVNVSISKRYISYFIDGEETPRLDGDKLADNKYSIVVLGTRVYTTSYEEMLESQSDVWEEIDGVQTVIATDTEVTKMYKKFTKTPFLVTHGRLHRLNEGYIVSDKGDIGITLNHRTMLGFADSPQLEKDWVKPANQMKVGFDMNSIDPTAFLSQGDSAVIFVNTANIAVLEEFCQTSGFKNSYIHYRKPRGLLFQCDGTLGDYRLRDFDHDLVALDVSPPRMRDAIAQTVHSNDMSLINNVSTILPRSRYSAKIVEYYTI